MNQTSKRGPKSMWQHTETTSVRVPIVFAKQVMEYAKKLDKGVIPEAEKPKVDDDFSLVEKVLEIRQQLEQITSLDRLLETEKKLKTRLAEISKRHLAQIAELNARIKELTSRDSTSEIQKLLTRLLKEQDPGGNIEVGLKICLQYLKGISAERAHEALNLLADALSEDRTHNNEQRRKAYRTVGLEPPKIKRTRS